MVILLAIKRFDFGGSENHVCDLANTFTQKGHTVLLVAKKGRQINRLSDKVKFIAINPIFAFSPFNVFLVALIILKHRVDVVHGHQRYGILLACLAGLVTCKPVVATVHGRTRFDLRPWLSLRIPNRIIFVSEQVLRVSKCYAQIVHKSEVIPNGKAFSPFSRNPIPGRILHVSRIDKNHYSFLLLLIQHVLPDLVEKHPHVSLQVVGDGEFLPNLKRLALSINEMVGRDVCLVNGYEPCLSNIFSKSALVLGVGRVALEALGDGVPLLVVNSKRLGQIVTHDYYPTIKANNFVDVSGFPPSNQALFNQIDNFLCNSNFFEREASLIQVRVASELSLDSVADCTLNVYSKCTRKK